MSKMKYSGVEWIGDIPIDWKVNRLRYNCTFKTGGTPLDKYGINFGDDNLVLLDIENECYSYFGNKYSYYENNGITRNEFCGGTKRNDYKNDFIPIEIEVFELKPNK